MFLSLEHPAGKGVSIFAHNLVTEEGFAPHLPNYNFECDRFRANEAIRDANEELGQKIGKSGKAFGMLFNQFNWENTTGHEYWSEAYVLMLRHALMVSEALELPLNIHCEVMDKLMDLAVAGELEFDFDVSTFSGRIEGGFKYQKQDIDQGKYFVLTNLVIKP